MPDKIKINQNGQMLEVNLLTAFKSGDFNRSYAIYTTGKKNANGLNIATLDQLVEENLGYTLKSMETEEEYARVKDILRDMAANPNKDGFNYTFYPLELSKNFNIEHNMNPREIALTPDIEMKIVASYDAGKKALQNTTTPVESLSDSVPSQNPTTEVMGVPFERPNLEEPTIAPFSQPTVNTAIDAQPAETVPPISIEPTIAQEVPMPETPVSSPQTNTDEIYNQISQLLTKLDITAEAQETIIYEIKATVGKDKIAQKTEAQIKELLNTAKMVSNVALASNRTIEEPGQARVYQNSNIHVA